MGTLQVETRERASSAQIESLRKRGILPMALVGHGKPTRLVQAPAKEVKDALHETHGSAVFSVRVEGETKPVSVVVKDVQRNPVTRKVVHLTLQEVSQTDTIRISIPIVFEGEPESVTKGESSLTKSLTSLEVQAVVSKLIDTIQIDVSKMGAIDAVHVADIELPEGIVTHLQPDQVVVSTKPLKEVSLEVEAPVVEVEAPAEEEKTEA